MRKIVCSKCGVVEAPHKCSKRYKEKHLIDKNRNDKRIYWSKEWRRLRDKVLSDNKYMCLFSFYCLGRIINAECVHHIIFINDNTELAYDENNVISLTHNVHRNIIHRLSDMGYKDEVQEILYKCNELWKHKIINIGALENKYKELIILAEEYNK